MVYYVTQKIVDSQSNVVGYELLLRHKDFKNILNFLNNLTKQKRIEIELATLQYVEKIVNQVTNCKIFVNLSYDFVSNYIAALKLLEDYIHQVVIEIVEFNRSLYDLKLIKYLAKQGYKIAFDDLENLNFEIRQILSIVDHLYAIKLDIDMMKFREVQNLLKASAYLNPQIIFIVEKIETENDLNKVNEIVTSLSIHAKIAYQGFLFSKPEPLEVILQKKHD